MTVPFSEFLENITQSYSFSHFQIAQNGIWEEAVQFFLQDLSVVQCEAVTDMVAAYDQDVAIEAFFCNENADILFLGIRLEKLSKQEQSDFVRNMLDKSSYGMKFHELVGILRDVSNAPELLSMRPDFLEVGAEGYWKSYGSQVVWDGSGHVLSLQDIKDVAPHLLKEFKKPMMLEMAYKNPMPYWLGLSLSERSENGFVFSVERYQEYIKSLVL